VLSLGSPEALYVALTQSSFGLPDLVAAQTERHSVREKVCRGIAKCTADHKATMAARALRYKRVKPEGALLVELHEESNANDRSPRATTPEPRA